MYPTPPMTAARTPSGQTAETLTLIGLILQGIFLLVWLATAIGALVVLSVGGIYVVGLVITYFLLLLIGVFAFWYAWTHFYQPTKAANYERAKANGIIAIILGFIGGGIIAGILYLVGYLKLGDAINEQRAMAAGAAMGAPGAYPGGPVYTAPGQPNAPPPSGAPALGAAAGATAGAAAGATAGAAAGSAAATPPPPASPPAPTCPRCGRPGTWIPQYNRFYCYTDQQYL